MGFVSTICDKCKLAKERTQVVAGLGPIPARLMIVGRNPGAQEDRDGYPFVGGAGHVLNSLLKDAGIKRSLCYVTNVVKCFTPRNREPQEDEIRSCLPHLFEEVRAVKPNAIVALGDLAMSTLVGVKGINTYRGSILAMKVLNIKVIPTFHPSYLMRGQQEYWSTVVSDLERAWKESEYPDFRFKETFYEIYDPAVHTQDWIAKNLMSPDNPISFDIETPGVLKPWKGPVIGCSFSYADGKAVHFNCRRRQSFFLVRDILEGPAPKIVQRGTFDYFFLRYHGVYTNNLVFDTKIAGHLVAPILPNSLPYLASVHTDVPFYKPNKTKGDKSGVVHMSSEELAEYNNTDADVTRRIYFEQLKELKEQGQLDLMSWQMRLVKTVSKMQLRGIKVDLAIVHEALKDIQERNDVTEKIFQSKGINIRSGAQIGELLTSLGCTLRRTPTGKYKTSKDDLAKLGHPVAKRLLQFREYDKLRSSFLEGIESRLVNGRVHTTYNTVGTLTGRLASLDPNLQNIPKRTRHIFVPDKGLFVEADYDSFEIRLIAVVAGEDRLQADLDAGLKIHRLICKEVYGTEAVDDAQYLRAKAIVFGTVYGRSALSIAREYGVSSKEAERIQSVVVGKYPKLGLYKASMDGKQMVQSLYGRVKLFDGKLTEMFNFPIQSAGADTLLRSMVLLDERLEAEGLEDDAEVALTVYDSLTVDTRPEMEGKIREMIKEIMERPIPELQGQSFPCSLKSGPNWRDLK